MGTLTLASRTPGQAVKSKKKSRQSTDITPVLRYDSLIELATPVASISAFCQAVLSKIIPNEFWGQGSTQEHNKKCFLKKVNHFIYLRRFESMCLHELMQELKVERYAPFLLTCLNTNNPIDTGPRVAYASRTEQPKVLSVRHAKTNRDILRVLVLCV
jgi:hypothetical protein